MILAVTYLLLSIGGFASLMYFTGMYTKWYFYFIPIVGIPLGYILLFLLTLAVLFPIAKATNIDKEVKKPSKIARFLVWQVDYVLLQLLGVRTNYIGFKKLSKKEDYMIIYNHISNFDPMVLMAKIRRLTCITKYGNKKAPIAGGMIHRAGYITIDRENDAEGIKAINKAIEIIKNHKGSIAVSPEGTRSKTLELLPFHPGTFNIAKRSGAPIVVVGIKNTNLIHKNVLKRLTKVECNILYVMTSDEYSDLSTSEIAHKLHTIYEEYLGGF